jgi:hypothetical protein
VIMLMVAMSLIADFTSVLLDTRDNAILHPRPVSGRTALLARIAHVATYLSLIALSLAIGTLIAGAFAVHPLFPIVYTFSLACAVSMVVLFVNLFYLVALRFTNGERFRDMILYFQIGMTMVVIGGYQLLPRLIHADKIRELRIDDQGWIYLWPPTWMAAPADLLAGHSGRPQIILAALAVTVPLVGLWAVVRFLAPRFNRALARLDVTPTTSERSSAATRSSPLSRLASFCSFRPVQRATFELIWYLCSRDRHFKLRAYSAMAFLFLFVFIIMINSPHGFLAGLRKLPETHKYLFLLYLGSTVLASILMHLRYGGTHEPAWVYLALPVARPGDILMAGLKVVLARFVVPTMAIVVVLCLAVWGPGIWPDMILALSVTLLMAGVDAMLFLRRFPFSESYSVRDASGRLGRQLFVLALPFALGGLHYTMLVTRPSTVLLAVPIVLIGALLILRRYAGTDWMAMAERDV